MKAELVALLLIALLRSSPALRPPHLRRLSPTRLHLFDHLIDCAAYPEIAAAYGGPNSPQCVDSGASFFLTAGFNQLATFAVLLFTYYSLKRGVNIFDLDDDDVPSTMALPVVAKQSNDDDTTCTCPKCNGSGVFTYGRGLEECDLCDGEGTIELQYLNTADLPSTVRKGLVWSDDDEM